MIDGIHELVSTKMNPNVLPHLHIWEWHIPLYLFLGGIAGGLLVITSVMIVMRRHFGIGPKDEGDGCPCTAVRIGAILSPLLLGIGMLFLFLDLTHKLYVWAFYTTIQPTSPMSAGSWILVAFFPLAVLQAMVVNRKYLNTLNIELLDKLIKWTDDHLLKVALLNAHIGVGIGIYTGILLSFFSARPLWSSSILGMLFLVSGISSASALLLLFAPKDEKHIYSRIDANAIWIELVIVGLFVLGGITGTANTHGAMMHLIVGDQLMAGMSYMYWFWGVFIAAGLLLPLLIEFLENAGFHLHLPPIAPVLVLIGGLVLRFLIVFAGQTYHTFM
ncbi:NrfD/PsrC family molybdoenzyme membrane anchor subunit [Pelodictyon phaeoclathratiforme]|jgi:formate-dependent nitrite reductase membrane component NrfD|uniref:Polysulphide reductase NrfD n=1 Tax=Pelodictyon phaeoclathratiforme (strain DSM 5477 / BU-1) TaxID=324925 RepID=B4SF50_PELPB|nr:NrfD/PsrC family molybdoenzyme membrane anchor subunit [Pelodictyon phaeoclathratiforme]ACF43197.1 Polysulphide reductase NrfD [Pelodictyon phaeoclathratiforme BU-1]MBV5290082.1 polysulfide reductase NrfD [Pelodictyon phaeoclathratiforme]